MEPPKRNLLQGCHHQEANVLYHILLHWARGVVIIDYDDVQRRVSAHFIRIDVEIPEPARGEYD